MLRKEAKPLSFTATARPDTRGRVAVSLALLAVFCAGALADQTVELLGRDLNGWSEESFAGHTRYRMTSIGDEAVLVASSRGSASTLYRRQQIDLDATPVLHWRWRVEQGFSGLDEITREQDDHPARVYVIASHGLLPWKARAICYVWTSGLASGKVWPNPYAPNVMMVALRSSDEALGVFKSEQRDVQADFKQYFDVDQRFLSGVAVMTDTDNTDAEAISYYANIRFSARERAP